MKVVLLVLMVYGVMKTEKEFVPQSSPRADRILIEIT